MKEILATFGITLGNARKCSHTLTSLGDVAVFANALARRASARHENATDDLDRLKIGIESAASEMILVMCGAVACGHDPIEGLIASEYIDGAWTFKALEPEPKPAPVLKPKADPTVAPRPEPKAIEYDAASLDGFELRARAHFRSFETIGAELGAVLHSRMKVHTVQAAIDLFSSARWKANVAISSQVDASRRAAIVAELLVWSMPLEENDLAVDTFDNIAQLAIDYDREPAELVGKWGKDAENIKRAAHDIAKELHTLDLFTSKANALAALKHEIKRSEHMTVGAVCAAKARLTTRRFRHLLYIQKIKTEAGID